MPCEWFDIARCPGCPKGSDGKYLANVVPPDMGEWANGDIVLVGEAPGADEDEQGIPFIGKTGMEMNKHYLWLAGLERDRVYFTNAVKCRPRNNKKPSDELRTWCSEFHLADEIERLQPRFVVLMGTTASALVPGIHMDQHHGLPLQRELFGVPCTVIPMWHPAVGIHDPKMMRPLREDFKRLRHIIRGNYEPPADPYREPDYRRIRNAHDLKEVVSKANWGGPMAIDTETLPGRIPWCLTFSCEPGTGYMIRTEDTDLLSKMAHYIRLWRGKFVFHNFAYDSDRLYDMGLMPRPMVEKPAPADMLGQLGINISMDRIYDTMIRAYNLARFERVGLKVLAYRLLGVEMQEFEDLVLPYSFGVAYEYLDKVRKYDWPKPGKTFTIQPDGSKKDKQPQGINTRIKRLFTDLGKCDAAGGDFDKLKAILLERWDNWPNDIVLPVIEKLGNMPEPSIAQVPEQEAIIYACRDADVTLRLVPVLDRMTEEITERFAA